MSSAADIHTRSLRMPAALNDAVREAAKRLEMSETQFLVQAVRYVLREAEMLPPDEAREIEAEWAEELKEDPFE